MDAVRSQQVDAIVEHIIVNDSGEPLRPAPWQESDHVMVVNTFRSERSVARNTGAAVSRGEWLYFLDDDDYPLPGAFATWIRLAQENPDAVYLYGGYETLNESDGTVSPYQTFYPPDLAPVLFAGETFPLQSGWIRRDAFFAAGGFDPLFVPAEDVDLLQRVSRLGPCVSTPDVLARVRVNHPTTTTTSVSRATELFRKMPEKWMQPDDSFSQVARSVRSRPYWAGRCARQFLTVGARRLRRGQVAATVSASLLAGRIGGRHLLAPEFWRGMRRAPMPQEMQAKR